MNLTPQNKKLFHKWKIGSINIQTCSDDLKLDLTLQECLRANLDVVCLQEVRMLNTGSLRFHGYNFYWSGQKRFLRHGVAMAIKDCSSIIIDSIQTVTDRLMAADLTVKGCKVRVISCYAPTLNNSALSTKQSFYRSLSKLLVTDKNRKVIVNGDFNAEADLCRRHSCFDGAHSSLDEESDQTNENNMLFLLFCTSKKLSILNTWFDHPIHHRVTWHHPNTNYNCKKVYDYSLSESWLRQYVTDVRVKNSYFNSDHRLLVTKLNTPCNKAARTFKPKKSLTKPNFQLLNQSAISERTVSAIEDHFHQNVFPLSIDHMHDFIISALRKGREILPRHTKKQSAVCWHQDQELSELSSERIELRKKKSSPQVIHQIKERTKKIRKRCKEIQNKILKEKGREINELKEQRNITKMWRRAKEHNTNIQSKPAPLQCPGLSNHFRNHFNPNHANICEPPELENPPEFIEILRDSNLTINNDSPSQEEITNAIKQLNSGKSSTDIEAEIVKLADSIPIFKEKIKNYFDKIWSENEVPTQWRNSRITPIWKRKGSSLDPSKYRGISTGSTLSKIGINIILKRLSTFYEGQLKRTQFGFRSGMGCNDAVYIVKQLQEIASASQSSLFACFIDLTAAFDHINRNLLFKTVRKRLADSHHVTTNIDLIQNLYQSTFSYIQNSDPNTDSFPITSGTRQGGIEGPPLYNFYSDFAIRVHDHRADQVGIPGLSIPYVIPNEATNRDQKSRAPTSGICNDSDAGYADDLGVFSWTREDLQNSIKILNEVFTEFGLEINLDKTKTMVFTPITDDYPEAIIDINGVDIENCSSFKYLGVTIEADKLSIGNSEVESRVNSAFSAFAEHKRLLTNKRISLQTRVLFLNALCRSRLTYGCHAWRPTNAELSKISSTYRYMLRSLLFNGYSRVNPPPPESNNDTTSSLSDGEVEVEDEERDWRYVVNNEALHEITRTCSIEEFYEMQQRNWIAHVIRRENDNICKILTFYDIKRKKLGRKSLSILERALAASGMTRSQFLKACFTRKLGT